MGGMVRSGAQVPSPIHVHDLPGHIGALDKVLERTLEGVLSLPFASPSALVLQHAQLPESREILIIAHRQHLWLVEAIERREGARADNVAREHARLSLTNLEIVDASARYLSAVV